MLVWFKCVLLCLYADASYLMLLHFQPCSVSGGLVLVPYATNTLSTGTCNTAPTPGGYGLPPTAGPPAPTAPTPPTTPPTSSPTIVWSSMYNQVAQVQCGDSPTGNTATDGVNLFGNNAREVVYRISLATTTTLTVTTCGSSYDTWLRYANPFPIRLFAVRCTPFSQC